MPTPSILCGPGCPPDNTGDSAGSTATIRTPGWWRLSTVATPRDYGRHWTPVHLDFAVDDLERAIARAEAAGARREGLITEHAYGRMQLLADPFGHGIDLLEFHRGGYDELVT